MSLGPLLCGIGYFGFRMIKEKRKCDFNFVGEDETVKWRNVIGFVCFSLIYLSVQIMVVMTFGLCL